MEYRTYCKKFNIETDLPHIYEWLACRNLRLPRQDEMPEHGLIGMEGNRAVAAGFIRLVEGGYAIIDGFVTDPLAPAEVRHRALDLIVKHLLFKAKRLGVKQLFAFSTDGSTLLRSQRHGFVPLPHSLIGLDLASAQGV